MPDTFKTIGDRRLIEALKELKQELESWPLDVLIKNEKIVFTAGQKQFTLTIVGEKSILNEKDNLMPLDYLVRMPAKVAALVLGKLELNRRVFARNCEVIQIKKSVANEFLERFHFMEGTDSAYCFGLFLKEELLAVATFSKGRKMRRLEEHERSFELIRFCTASGITVTGGLSKLMKTFCEKRGAAEIMTYVDGQFSSGLAFSTAGFVMHEKTEPREFLVNKESLQRIPFDGVSFDRTRFYVTRNAGNIKMLFSCRRK
jgi:hypothetical protein